MRNAKRLVAIAVTVVILGACGSAPDVAGIGDLPEADTGRLIETIQASGTPAVVNVWASWCGPCRSEAPLLAEAAAQYEGTVGFFGLNTRDTQTEAKQFIAEFFGDAPIDHVFDRDGTVVADLGGTAGVPLTFFVADDGTVAKVHYGVIDERTLVIEIDELLRTTNHSD